jgi:zinc transport system substrate-binding protein
MRISRRAALAGVVGVIAAAGGSSEAAIAGWAVASIKPVHSLLAAVMAGGDEPQLLVRGYRSPHSYTLAPSDVELIDAARVLFWIGPSFERFLARTLMAAGSDTPRSVRLIETPGLKLYRLRRAGLWNLKQAAQPIDSDTVEAAVDGHIWLDPYNAKLLVSRMASQLAIVDPAHARRYAQNAQTVVADIGALDSEIAATLAPIADRPFVVFHDAYQYLEARYGLSGAGSITLDPEVPPSAARLSAIQKKLAERPGVCLFEEPRFPSKLLEAIAPASARIGQLDPEGLDLPEGPELYPALMRGIASGLRDCLGS